MMTLQRILCPVDFSESSRRALRHALAIARWHESAVSVLHVDDALLYAASFETPAYPDVSGRGYAELRDFINKASGDDRNVTLHTARGDAVAGILNHAARHAADLIVMGTNGRSGLARAVLGSVTERVVRESIVPVLTIPPSADIPADDPMPFDPILCASDFSPACRKALELSIMMAQEADARLILLHTMQLPDFDPGLSPVPFAVSPAIDFSEFRKDALARLKRGLPTDAVFRCRPEAVVTDGRPAAAILDTAYREDVKLIVMGIQARGALDRLLFGSTTRQVMQAATCPVLSIRAGKDAEPWPAWPVAAQGRVAAAAGGS